MSKNFSPLPEIADARVANPQTTTPAVTRLRDITSILSKELIFLGGGYRSRTDDPLLAKQVL